MLFHCCFPPFLYIYIKKENWLIFKASSEPTKNPTDLKKQWLSGKRGVSENKGEKKGGNSSRKCESHPGVELPLCCAVHNGTDDVNGMRWVDVYYIWGQYNCNCNMNLPL